MTEAYGIQKVTYHNLNDFALEKLTFRIRYPEDQPDCKIQKITNPKGKVYSYTDSEEYAGTVEILLEKPLKAHKKIDLVMEFSVPVKYRSYYIFGYLTNYNCWHPWAVPYRNGELQPLEREFASYHVEFEIPEEKTIVTSGEIVSEKILPDGLKQVVSRIEHITNYGAFFLDGVIREEREVGGVKIAVYHQPDSAAWTKGIEEYAPGIVEFYIKELGFYPQKVINIIPGSKTFGGGFPHASNVFSIHQFGGTNKHGITAHEIAHSYWGFDYVSVPYEYGHWLGIGLGIYTDNMYMPDDPPYGGGYHFATLKGYNTTIMQSNEEFSKLDYDWNSDVCHSKSFAVVMMLEYIVGEFTFRKIFDTLLGRYKYSVLTAEDFQEVSEEISGQDLEWFFQPWLYTNHTCDYEVTEVKTSKNEDEFITRVGVKRTGQIPMPVEIQVTTLDSSTHVQTFPRDSSEGSIEFITTDPLMDVQLDPFMRLPLISRIYDEWAISYAYSFHRSGQYNLCLEYCERLLHRDPENARVIYYQGMAYRKLGRFDLAMKSFQKALQLQENGWGYVRMGYIYDLQGHREMALDAYRKAIALPDYRGSKAEAEKRIDEPYTEEIGP
jgi:hypothetical protein